MKYLNFLDDEDYDKLELLMTLQHYNEQFLTKKKLIELTGLSKFLLDKYITELNAAYPELKIHENSYDELFYQSVSNDLIQSVQYDYIQRSLKFRFFIEVLVEEKTIKRFQEEQHIARTTLYQIRGKVVACLEKEQIFIKKNKLTGNEMNIRSLIFDIVAYFYFGKKYPFSKENDKEAQQLLQQLLTYFNLDLSFFQKEKLALFIHIVQIRIRSRHLLKETLCSSSAKTQQVFGRQLVMIEQALHTSEIPISDNFKESNYLLLFLFITDIFDVELRFDQTLFTQSQEATKRLIKQLTTQFQISNSQQKQLYDSFFKKILGLSTFKQSYTTFIETTTHSYFADVYAPVHNLILNFTRKDHFLLSLELSQRNQTKLYYDIMFTILSLLEPSQFGKPINIYVDFSSGAAYTEYIRQSLKRFRDLNIAFQEKFNNDTHIFLSDYRLQEANCQQIIWKQPPTPANWSKFANLVVKLRKFELEKITPE
ncbi:hypothetical protein ATZ33_14455 [Enterococcus silesiacus]|uniref:Mga helix-turn-helix domain-containing protein n=1 Tax=Enterococcus silesiacus TaxID=332949 RepID=A0A0S3KE24_9ENTE|nr:helix-turn-helix domain-containing protein [Enterococcus silesiacus]ALS02535.1 hypothetical protein ATZ33_14455 [Enterococcus silesiacus]OJG93551.1 hypothetical protein RV15_GL000153 [Enterococcus silesiacus]